MSGLLTKRSRAETNNQAELEYVKFVLTEETPAIYVTKCKNKELVRDEFKVAKGNVFDVTTRDRYGDERDLDPPLVENLEAFAKQIEKARDGGNTILLHCREGRARSLICLGVYLMKHKGWSKSQVMEQINLAFTKKDSHADRPGNRVDDVLLNYENSYISRGAPQDAAEGAAQSAGPRRSKRDKRGQTTE